MKSKIKHKTISITLVNLGCPKNLVDSEIILGLLHNDIAFEVEEDVLQADVMLLNTCAFIKEAKEESIDLILELAQLKKDNPAKKLVVIGCLVQRHLPELQNELPEVDLWVSLPEIPALPNLLKQLVITTTKKSHYAKIKPDNFLYNHETPRLRITPAHYAYIKIAEGCSNVCSFCAVPLIKGKYKSRKSDSILTEAQQLAQQGVKEINLIAQDTTNYGSDLKQENMGNLALLLEEICQITNLNWIRILYTHPAHITDALIKVIAQQEKICKYIDLPLQHIDNKILASMGRKADYNYIVRLINKLRESIPSVIIRSAFIVGYPGETEQQFQTLLQFIEETKFERLGIFKYSAEEGTKAYKLENQVSESIKEQRFHKAMQLQQEVAREVNKKFLNKNLDILVESDCEDNPDYMIGRSYADAPDVDGCVYVKNGTKLEIGDFVSVKIIDTLEYDLIGVIN